MRRVFAAFSLVALFSAASPALGAEVYISELRLFTGTYCPHDWVLADGHKLRVQDNQALYSLIGNRYGGDHKEFALPDYRNLAPSIWPLKRDQHTAIWCIAMSGDYPARSD